MNRIDVVSFLIENGVNTTLCTNKGYNALHFACSKGHVEIMKLIIRYENFINERNSYYKKRKYYY